MGRTNQWTSAVVAMILPWLTGMAWAQSPVPPEPKPMSPTTQPTTDRPEQVAQEGPATVLILPFRPFEANDQQVWMGQAIQQNLLAELGAVRTFAPMIPPADWKAPENLDPQSAREAGQQFKAQFVLFGSIQVVEPEMRLIGHLLSVETGRFIGTIKATGSDRDLFGLQDVLATQARRLLMTSNPDGSARIIAPGASAPLGPFPKVESSGPLRADPPIKTCAFDGSSIAPSTAYSDAYRRSAYNYAYAPYTYQPYYIAARYPHRYGYGYGYGYGYRSSLNWSFNYQSDDGRFSIGGSYGRIQPAPYNSRYIGRASGPGVTGHVPMTLQPPANRR